MLIWAPYVRSNIYKVIMEIINFGDPPDILEEPDDDVTPKKCFLGHLAKEIIKQTQTMVLHKF